MRKYILTAAVLAICSTQADAGPLRNFAGRVRTAVQNRPLLFRPVALTRATVAAAVVPVTKVMPKAKAHCPECEKAAVPAKK